jgi:hypothetical protein
MRFLEASKRQTACAKETDEYADLPLTRSRKSTSLYQNKRELSEMLHEHRLEMFPPNAQ